VTARLTYAPKPINVRTHGGSLMSTLTKRLLIAAAILGAIASQALPAEAGDWFFSEKVDPVTDEKYTGLMHGSDAGTEYLAIMCSGGKLSVTVLFKQQFITLEKNLLVKQRVGSKPAEDVVWGVSDTDTLSHPAREAEALRFVKAMAAEDRFILRAVSATATFQIGNLAAELPKLKGCIE